MSDTVGETVWRRWAHDPRHAPRTGAAAGRATPGTRAAGRGRVWRGAVMREAVAAAATARARVVATALPAAQEEGVVAVGEGHAALKQRHENRPSRRRRRWSTRLRMQGRRRRWVGAEELPRCEAEAEAEAAAATGCTRWRQVCAPQPAVVAGCSAREPPCHAVQSEELLARQLAAPHG